MGGRYGTGYYDARTGDPNGQLTDKQKRFCKIFVEDRYSYRECARLAGYKSTNTLNVDFRLLRHPKIQKEIARYREEYRVASGMTKRKVIEGFLEAINIARQKGDSSPMIAGYREIAKMCGLYAPTKAEIKISGTVQQQIQHLSSLSDAELLNIVEGEYEEVEDDEGAGEVEAS